jgi:hypothetical protein
MGNFTPFPGPVTPTLTSKTNLNLCDTKSLKLMLNQSL